MVELVAGIIVSLAIALWQHLRARSAERKLEGVLSEMPQRVASQVGMVVAKIQIPSEATKDRAWPDDFIRVDYADVDGDGRNELLVQYPSAAHGNTLLVYGFRDGMGWDFTLLDELGSGTAAPFEVRDFDNDGKLEIALQEADWSTDLPYYLAPRLKLLYRWNGKKFGEVGRIKDYTAEDLERLREKHREATEG
jgi:hypothetical protein